MNYGKIDTIKLQKEMSGILNKNNWHGVNRKDERIAEGRQNGKNYTAFDIS